MCKVLDINHSTYRKSINHKMSKRDIFTHKLDCDIRMIQLESKCLLRARKDCSPTTCRYSSLILYVLLSF